MKKRPHETAYRWILLMLPLILVTGCASPPPHPVHREGSPPNNLVVLSPGDQIDIKFFYVPDLNESQRIRPDGKITLQLVGAIRAEGKTPEQLQSDIRGRYQGLIEKPDVSVIVKELGSRYIYVGGAVNYPGRIDMPGTLPCLNAVIQAGGFNLNEASVENVVVIRHHEGQREAFMLDFSETLDGAPGPAFFLHPQDIVYVPRTRIVNVNQWIEQYINRIVPQFGFTYSRPVGDGTMGIDTSR